MNSEWVELIKNASGKSEYIFALIIDIRGFTNFCQTVDSVDVSTYIKKLYVKILDDYFPKSTYSKPMGDGLFITIKYEEENLEVLANEIVDNCIKLVDNFETILNDDPMITYDIPKRIGIGLTRGSACCIQTDDKIIDYSGKTLNHASRLLDKARPYGMICDFKEFDKILKPELRELFEEDEVCLRGISEKDPIKILYLKNKVEIDEKDKLPINEPKWHEYAVEYEYSAVKTWRKLFSFYIDKKPISPNDVILIIARPKYINGEPVKDIFTYQKYDIKSRKIKYNEEGGKPVLGFTTTEFKNSLKEENLPDNSVIIFHIRYTI